MQIFYITIISDVAGNHIAFSNCPLSAERLAGRITDDNATPRVNVTGHRAPNSRRHHHDARVRLLIGGDKGWTSHGIVADDVRLWR